MILWWEENQLRLTSITNVIRSQSTVILQPEWKSVHITFIWKMASVLLIWFARTKCRLRLGFVGLRVIISRTHHHRMVWILWKAVDVHIVALVVGRNRILDFQRWQSDLLRLKVLKDYVKQERRKFKSQQKVGEPWSVAKEEASKSKAAKEVIKALTSRITILWVNSFGRLLL